MVGFCYCFTVFITGFIMAICRIFSVFYYRGCGVRVVLVPDGGNAYIATALNSAQLRQLPDTLALLDVI